MVEDTLEIFLLIVEDKHLSKDLEVEEVIFYLLEVLYQTFWKQVLLLLLSQFPCWFNYESPSSLHGFINLIYL